MSRNAPAQIQSSTPNRRAIGVSAVLAAALFAPQASAQCAGRWDASPGGAGSGILGFAALALPFGDVVVGGLGSSASVNVGKCHPATATWTPMGAGLGFAGQIVTSLAQLPDGTIVAGGYFNGPATPQFIAKWNDAQGTWSTLGTGLDANVHALVIMPDGTLIAGGNFTHSGTQNINRVARWNPQTSDWSGWTGFSPQDIYSLAALPNGDVVAAGGLLYRLSAASNTWTTLSVPFTGVYYALAVLPNQDLVAASSNGVWRQDKTSGAWSRLGTLTGSASALTLTPEGHLVAFGGMNLPGSSAHAPWRWNPATATWSALGTGLTANFSYVESGALAVLPNGDIFCSGGITAAGALPVVYAATWTTRPICPADFNCSGTLEVQDIFDFINAWLASDPHADFNRVNAVTIDDIFDFLNAWFTGC